MRESPTIVLNEFTEMLKSLLSTQPQFSKREVMCLVYTSQAHALDRYIKRLDKEQAKADAEEAKCEPY